MLRRNPSPASFDTAPTVVAHVPTDPLLGRRLADRFQIEHSLAQGGSAIVYSGVDVLTDRRIAIKVSRTLSNDALVARFGRDATLRGMFDHPHAVRTLASGIESDGTMFMVSELLSGLTLASALNGRSSGIDRVIALRTIDQLASALESAHLIGLIHGDIKPSNVLIEGSRAKIDFGFSRLTLDPTTGAPWDRQPPLYKPVYSAPEQLRRGRADARTDVYALGVLAYHCLAGAPPFRGSIEELRRAHLGAPVPPIPGVPKRIDAMVRDMMEKDPCRRIASMEEARARIAACSGRIPSVELDVGTLLVSMPVRE